MKEEIKRGLVLKASILVICLSITAMVYKFAGNSNNVYDYNTIDTILTLTPSSVETLGNKRIHTWPEDVDTLDAYMKHWYEVVDTNSDGVPDIEENIFEIIEYEGFYDVPAGADSIIMVKGKLYGMNDEKTEWVRLKKNR